MDVREEYNRKRLTLEEAAARVQPNTGLCVALGAAEPVGLLTQLGKRRDVSGVRIFSCMLMREYDTFLPENRGRFLNETWFYNAWDRKHHAEGMSSYIPNNLHEAAPKKIANDRPRVFWGTATPMDRHGFFSLSLSLTYEKDMIRAADYVVLEINENLPWTLGDTAVHISEVDAVVENNCPLFELPPARSTTEEEAIGHYIAELVEDGSTIQLGIGGIPNALARCLMGKKDLGIHTEMMTDGMVDLFEAGVITNRRKTLWPGKMVGAFALGSRKLYDFIDHNLGVELHRGPVVNDPCAIGRNHRMVSINTTLQVDLTGQCCSEALGSRHYSGTGGQVDTHRGAQRSEGGKAFIALRSTARENTVSTIVSALPAGSNVTLGRSDVDRIVTEFGVAHLKGRSVRDRVRAMIAIAHPTFRDGLREEAERLQLW